MITCYLENNQLHLICSGVNESAALDGWINQTNPSIVYEQCWYGVTTPDLPHTKVGLVARELSERGIILVQP